MAIAGRSGHALGTPGSPTFTPDLRRVTFFNPGDTLEINLHDTREGLRTTVHDLDTGEIGDMTASVANGFPHVLFQPNATRCTSAPYAFHPMYSTASEHTRVPWAAKIVSGRWSRSVSSKTSTGWP